MLWWHRTPRPRGIGCHARCVSAWDTVVTHHLEAKLLQNVPRHFLRAGQLGPSLETEARGRLRTMPIQSGACSLSAWPNQHSLGLLVKTGPVSACLAQPARRLIKKISVRTWLVLMCDSIKFKGLSACPCFIRVCVKEAAQVRTSCRDFVALLTRQFKAPA